MKRTAAGLCAALATLAATTTALAPATAAADPAIDWGRCEDADLRKAKAQCGTLRVPLDHADPGGERITIAVSRLRATAPQAQRQGPMLVNPGGPGGAGLTLPLYFARTLPKKVTARFDIIGFDPRGVAESSPLDCGEDAWRAPQPAYRPQTERYALPGPNELQWLDRAEDFADACEAKYGDELAHYGTDEVVDDIDAIRRALGVDRISYYGYSYGTKLGHTYATRYPGRLHRLVLDANVHPEHGWYEATPVAVRAFEAAMGRFFAWTAKWDRVYHLGDTAAEVEQTYLEHEAELLEDPLPRFGPSEWNDTFAFTAGYVQGLWPELASVWAKWQQGRTKPMLAFADDGSTAAEDRNATASFLAVTCLDGRFPRDYERWRQDAFDLAEAAPFRAWSELMSATPCRVWPVEPRDIPDVGNDDVDVLLLGSTGDAATPFSGSLAVRKAFPRSSLVALTNSIDHGVSLGGNRCVDRHVIRYLLRGTLPTRAAGDGPDATCKAGPAPKPNKADLKAAKGPYARGGDGGDGGNA